MNKFLILDKIVKPEYGGTMILEPEHQVLIPGVWDMLERYWYSGWKFGIAQNESQCIVWDSSPIYIPVGSYLLSRNKDDRARILRKEETPGGIRFYLDGPLDGAEDFIYLSPESTRSFQWKTVEEAIAQMEYQLCLLPAFVNLALICPDFGRTVRVIGKTQAFPTSVPFTKERVAASRELSEMGSGVFQKPDGGMIRGLEYLLGCYNNPNEEHRTLVIGNEEKDHHAALAAGAAYLTIDEWLETYPTNEENE